MKPLQFAATLMLLFCLLLAVNATPGKVYINGKCIDCNRPDDDAGIITPPDHNSASSMSYTLTSGAIFFGIMYNIFT
ncbi:bomanin-836 [Drosophila teissieri]|uniref:bomanin-836 n=1 Tax=Drosophila teissieri TaxID=7243 RepID=UPI001CBA597C|nr:bomanin-836 [Drosophila teissieri]